MQNRNKPICGAQLRNKPGKFCQDTVTLENGRCRRHGGKSLKGVASPLFKHGRYSKSLPENLVGNYRQAQKDPKLLELRDEIALMDVRINELLSQLTPNEHSPSRRITRLIDKVRGAAAGNSEAAEALAQLEDIIGQSSHEDRVWKGIGYLVDRRKALVETESKRLLNSSQAITIDQVMLLIGVISDILKRHIPDKGVLTNISREIYKYCQSSTGVSQEDLNANTADDDDIIN